MTRRTKSRIRTDTGFSAHEILSLACLPVSPSWHTSMYVPTLSNWSDANLRNLWLFASLKLHFFTSQTEFYWKKAL